MSSQLESSKITTDINSCLAMTVSLDRLKHQSCKLSMHWCLSKICFYIHHWDNILWRLLWHVMQEFVNEVWDMLDGIKDALVCIPRVTGISNEQCKRLTIAVELVVNPSIIFMDGWTNRFGWAAAIIMRAVIVMDEPTYLKS